MTAFSTGGPLSMTVAVVVVPVAALALGLGGLEGAVDGVGRVVGDVAARGQAAVVGEHDVAGVLVDDPDGPALEPVAVLAEDVGVRALAHDRADGQDEDVGDLLDRHAELDALAGPEAPDAVGLALAGVFAVLV